MADTLPPNGIERRRTIRIKRSGLLQWKLDDIDRPSIKIAETVDEYEQAFRLVHDTYLRTGYLKEPKPHGMLFGIHSLLPETVVFVAKSYLTVLSTLTEIFDTPSFGLPMDVIYRKELDELRKEGRKIVELSALVTPPKLRWRNLFMLLAQVMYQYSQYRGVNDLCIAVNPKHVRFYKTIFLFEPLGPERHYPRVDAPAVALRVNMDDIADRLKKTYDSLELDCNLYAYFHQMTGFLPQKAQADLPAESSKPAGPPAMNGRRAQVVRHFMELDPALFQNLTPEQQAYLHESYPQIDMAPWA
ncbi:hypothetical protein SAMN02746041_02635 [Desulfacinum hydrothermale DSM 13146]|uniref:N-acyl amino acid synthase FeeM catalytic core domain-containing protein n=1 Tax=Desulfacinum hydrothermale DSM 13146 TaxID=1121390 RepID=A0A1W1XRD5_9BACT|nr:hypothetical protein [Desulfacinum hydrothermale]SMC26415.1 hypothetical protein SAMN02746041_02635 [Desulfacinum hydrothermale DSM 13146]